MDKTQEKILKSVKKCQGLYGLKKMTMEDVANQANLSRQTVYEKFGSKKKLVAAFFAGLSKRVWMLLPMNCVRKPWKMRFPWTQPLKGITLLYEGLAVQAPVQRESWARFLFEKEGQWWAPAKMALQTFLQERLWPDDAVTAENRADVVLRHLSSTLWQPAPPEAVARQLVPFLQVTHEETAFGGSNFEDPNGTKMPPNNLRQKVWRLAWPVILSNCSVPLLGMVDAAVMGHLDSPVYLGASH